MLRLALIALTIVIAGLALVALLPERQREVPDAAIRLENVTLALYPQADREARWHFQARAVDYQPASRESVLYDLEEGRRMVGDKTDFTLCSEQVLIDSRDNLRSDEIYVHLVEENWDMQMQGSEGSPVYIDQARAMFEIPRLSYTGEGLGPNNYNTNVRMTFDLSEFDAEGGYNEFIDGDTTYIGETMCPKPSGDY